MKQWKTVECMGSGTRCFGGNMKTEDGCDSLVIKATTQKLTDHPEICVAFQNLCSIFGISNFFGLWWNE